MDLIMHVKTFATVARCGSFTDAARQLDVVPSVVARRIAQLEARLNTRLFERSTRKVNLTEAGERFYARAGELVDEFEDLVGAVERDSGKLEGHLRVMAPTTLTIRELAPVFSAFLHQHPRITLEISLVDQSASPAERGFDVAISGRLSSYEGVVDIPLRPVRPVLCASPEYLREARPLVHPRDLAAHPCLVFTPTGTHWNFQSGRGIVSVDVNARLRADDNMTLLTAASAGLGITLLPLYVVADSLECGKLIPLLPDFSPQENWFKAYVPRRRMNVARVKALVAWLEKEWPL
ncbi:LysR family transcriptional regulator [Paraburkholderia bannensis]|uniref:LysR family transcriptional regulator n=1 Tax=Paraburkholderia bannensis TaxID=765414 RepID=UPI002AB741E8|nr:LysR family transcriptional regulator [Paraburkholderia bannensis]